MSGRKTCVTRGTAPGLRAVAASVALLTLSAMAAPAGRSGDRVTLSVNAVCTGEVHYSVSGEVTEDDLVTVTLIERNVYRIAEWNGPWVRLELVSGRREVNPVGGGTYDVPHVPELSSRWSYERGPQPDSPESSVRIDPKGRSSTVSVVNFVKGGAVRVDGRDRNAAVALSVAEMTLSSYVSDDLLKGKPSPMSQQLQFPFDPDQKRVQATGHGSHRFEMKGEQGAVMTGTLEVSFTVDFGPAPEREELEVSVEPAKGYETWIPKGNLDEPGEPGSDPLEVTLTVHRKGNRQELREASLKVALPYVSKNKGVCGNWPKDAGEEEGLRFRETDFSEGGGLLYRDRTHLETAAPVEGATFLVHGYDYGAWGTLRVTATDADGNALKVRVRGKETPDLDIPLDADSNRIADAWERGKTWGRSRTDDDETVAGQDSRGDGLTLYDEYRGLVVPDGQGGRQFRRLEPDVKEIFLLDPANAFPTAKWEAITKIRALRLNDSLVDPKGNPGPGESPLVNFDAEDRKANPVYALKIVVGPVPGPCDPSPACALLAEEGLPWRIGNAEAVYVEPARFQGRIDEDFKWLDTAITIPGSEAGRQLIQDGPGAGITYADACDAWGRLKDASLRKSIAARLQTAVFLHEVGHLGGLPDHLGIAPGGQEDLARACLMTNQGDWGRRRTVVYTALGRGGDPDFAYPYLNFCRDVQAPGYRCYRSLKFKDW